MRATETLDEVALQNELLAHAGDFRDYVAQRIPQKLASMLSPEDVLQEAWSAAFRTRASFRARGPHGVEGWLRTIVDRKLVDALRTVRRHKRGGGQVLAGIDRPGSSSLAGLPEGAIFSGKTPSREVSTREASDAIHIALSALPVDRRRAVELRYIEGLTPGEIAERMGKAEAAVNSLLFHGKRELRERLGHAAKYFSDARSADPPPGGDGEPKS